MKIIARMLFCGLVLGATGLISGYYGPLRLNPGANAGPLLGIFFTGPLAVSVGVFVGYITARLGARAFVAALITAAAAVAGVTLYLSLPRDRWEGFVIDAEIRDCQSPAVPRLLERDRGVVLSMTVSRRWDIYEHRKPWNRGRLYAKSSRTTTTERYFARVENGSCSQFHYGDRRMYAPEWEESNVSPPDVLPTLLGLYVLKPVPARFAVITAPFPRPLHTSS